MFFYLQAEKLIKEKYCIKITMQEDIIIIIQVILNNFKFVCYFLFPIMTSVWLKLCEFPNILLSNMKIDPIILSIFPDFIMT